MIKNVMSDPNEKSETPLTLSDVHLKQHEFVEDAQEEVTCSKGSEAHSSQNSCPEEEMSKSGDKPLSKNQIKRLKKTERWQEMKPLKRAKERQRRKERRREALQRGEDLGPTRKKLKCNTMKNSNCRVHVAIDCSFDDLMSQKDINQFVQQIQNCYAANRRAADPMQLHLTSLGGKTQERLDSIGDYKGWDVFTDAGDYLSVFDKDKVVYLSSESDHVLDTLEADKCYIIGGLVDHNHQKGLCHRLAQEKGVAHAQLPIGQYIDLKSRKVLTINHVYEILLRFTETNNWEEAFFKVIPKRKGAAAKNESQTKTRSGPCIGSSNSDSVCQKITHSKTLEASQRSELELASNCETSKVKGEIIDNTGTLQHVDEGESTQSGVRTEIS